MTKSQAAATAKPRGSTAAIPPTSPARSQGRTPRAGASLQAPGTPARGGRRGRKPSPRTTRPAPIRMGKARGPTPGRPPRPRSWRRPSRKNRPRPATAAPTSNGPVLATIGYLTRPDLFEGLADLVVGRLDEGREGIAGEVRVLPVLLLQLGLPRARLGHGLHRVERGLAVGRAHPGRSHHAAPVAELDVDPLFLERGDVHAGDPGRGAHTERPELAGLDVRLELAIPADPGHGLGPDERGRRFAAAGIRHVIDLRRPARRRPRRAWPPAGDRRPRGSRPRSRCRRDWP